jgi:hypothetical protein
MDNTKLSECNVLGMSEDEYTSLLEDYPALAECTSLRDASRHIFGIATMTHLVSDASWRADDAAKLVRFFENNHSGLSDWAKLVDSLSFHGTEANKKTYFLLVKELGLNLAVRLSQDRDFNDVCTGYMWLKTDKKRMTKFKKDILEALPMFPASAHSVMIHDYIMDKMKAEERKAEKGSKGKAPLVTLPVPDRNIMVPEGWKLLWPMNQTDLRRIGSAQGHCVGTKQFGYGSKIVNGEIWIFAIYSKALADGVCVEMTRSGTILQMQGKHRRSAKSEEIDIIDNIISNITRPKLSVCS